MKFTLIIGIFALIVGMVTFVLREYLQRFLIKMYHLKDIHKVILFLVFFLFNAYIGRKFVMPINTGALTKIQEFYLFLSGINSLVWQPLTIPLVLIIPIFMDKKWYGIVLMLALLFPMRDAITFTGVYVVFTLAIPFLILGIWWTVSIYKIINEYRMGSPQL